VHYRGSLRIEAGIGPAATYAFIACVLWGHVFRNSLITIVALLGLQLPVLIGGAIFIEYVFSYGEGEEVHGARAA
jgi:ABC-type microcin C transport system permease subunit YejB